MGCMNNAFLQLSLFTTLADRIYSERAEQAPQHLTGEDVFSRSTERAKRFLDLSVNWMCSKESACE